MLGGWFPVSPLLWGPGLLALSQEVAKGTGWDRCPGPTLGDVTSGQSLDRGDKSGSGGLARSLIADSSLEVD